MCEILIVENHTVLRAAISAWIEAIFPDCTLIQSGCGEEALALARDCVDLIAITDVHLPDINGIEMARRLSEYNIHVRVIVISTQEGATYRTEALNIGAVAYIPKHRVASDLIPTLQHLLAVEYGNAEVEFGNAEVEFGNADYIAPAGRYST
jgi:DNA-binding NarL/FixJ family response regulator